MPHCKVVPPPVYRYMKRWLAVTALGDGPARKSGDDSQLNKSNIMAPRSFLFGEERDIE